MRSTALFLGSSVTLFLLSTAGFADPAPPAGSGATMAAAATDADQIECRVTPPPTGSRLGGGRECHSHLQWMQREKDSEKATEQLEMRGLQGKPPGG